MKHTGIAVILLAGVLGLYADCIYKNESTMCAFSGTEPGYGDASTGRIVSVDSGFTQGGKEVGACWISKFIPQATGGSSLGSVRVVTCRFDCYWYVNGNVQYGKCIISVKNPIDGLWYDQIFREAYSACGS